MAQTQKWTEPKQKFIGVPLEKQFEKASDGAILVRGYFTSDSKDEYGDIITRGATERAVPKYRRWGNIRYMHLPRPVAKVTRIGNEDGLEWNEVEIKVVDPETIFMVENDLLSALSVGIMINFEDVDFMEDGGLLINDYTLAEISLVDHPANYDAFLKSLPVDQSLQMLVRTYGLDAVSSHAKQLFERTEPVDDIIENAVPTEPVEEPVIEDEVMEEEPVDEVTEEPAAEQEEPVAEVEEVPAEEPVLEAEPVLAASVADLFKGLEEEIISLSAALSEIKETLKALVEAQSATGQTVSEETAIEDVPVTDEKSLDPEPEEDDAELGGEPAARKGAVPETTLPEADTTEDQEPVYSGLRAALRSHFANLNR